MNNSLQSAQSIASVYLANFANSENFWQEFEVAFGSNYDRNIALNIQKNLANQAFAFPEIVLVDRQILGTADGAFAAGNNTIYLSNYFVNNNDSQRVAATLIEEIGHWIDAQINTQDSAGDEGEIFSALVMGETLNPTKLARLKTENDHAVIQINGQELSIEQANITGTNGDDYLSGTDLADTINALAGDDHLDGGEGNDTLNGGDGNDTIYGDSLFSSSVNNGNDTLNGGDGNDTIYGDSLYSSSMNDGNNKIDGGAGNDSINAGNGTNTVNGGTGIDAIEVDLSSSTTNIIANISTSSFTFSGTTYTNVERFGQLSTGSGNDTITGGAYDDVINSGAGNDTVNGGAGNDTVNGGAGNDTVNGGAGDDSINAGNGTNTVNGGTGIDAIEVDLSSNTNNLIANISTSSFTFSGTTYTNVERFGWLSTGSGNDTITGGAYDDSINAGAGNDTVNTGAGNDYINAGAGTNTVNGGTGIDAIKVDLSTNTTNLTANISTGSFTVPGTTYTNVERFGELSTGRGNDTITGGAYDDQIDSGAGNDTVNAGAGNDEINSGAGDDTVNAGAGNDRIFGSAGNDTVNGGAGNDFIYAGSGNNILNGGDGNDDIYGSGNSKIDGGAGNDYINAEYGTHTVNGGTGIDAIKVYSYSDTNLTVNISTGSFTIAGSTFTNVERFAELSTSDGNDTITGGAYDDRIDSWSGNDTVNAGAGNDFIRGGNGNDTLNGGAGDDQINAGNGDDTVNGGAGNDILDGSFYGNKTFSGGDGNDTYLFNTAYWGNTTIQESGSGTDTVKFGEGLTLDKFHINRQGNDLIFTVKDTNETVTIKGGLGANSANIVERFQFDNGATTLTIDQLPIAPSLTGTYQNLIQIVGNSKIKFTINQDISDRVTQIFAFKVDDLAGNINGIAPTATDYAAQAVSKAKVIFSSISHQPAGFDRSELARIVTDFKPNDLIGFYAVQDNNPIFLGTTPNSTNFKATDLGNNGIGLNWRSADNRLNIDIVATQTTEIPRVSTTSQNSTEGLVLDLTKVTLPAAQVNFTVYREAEYNNSVGFYKVLNASGAIQTSSGILNPQDAGYVKAALEAAVSKTLGAEVNLATNNQSSITSNATLDKSLYMPIITVNGTLAEAASGQKLGQTYTSFLGANPDKANHIRLLGDNTFGFEDLVGGGDLDFNDTIVKVQVG